MRTNDIFCNSVIFCLTFFSGYWNGLLCNRVNREKKEKNKSRNGYKSNDNSNPKKEKKETKNISFSFL